MFKSQEVGTGCAFILAYAGVWFVLFIIVVLVFAGGFGPGGAEAFGYLFFVLASYATCIGGSIAISRDHGFRLTSPRQYRKRLEGTVEAGAGSK